MRFNMTYVFWIVATIIAFLVAFLLPLYQKRISTHSIAAFIFGIFLLASSISTFAAEESLTSSMFLDRGQLNGISMGFANFGLGLVCLILTPFRQLPSIMLNQLRQIPAIFLDEFFGKKIGTPENLATTASQEALTDGQKRALMLFAYAIFFMLIGISHLIIWVPGL
jgi:hypothetical protein